MTGNKRGIKQYALICYYCSMEIEHIKIPQSPRLLHLIMLVKVSLK